MSTGHRMGVGDEDTDGKSVFLSQRSAEKRLQGSELSTSKQQLARQERLGLPQRPSPKSLPADEGKHNFTNDSLMEHRQGQCPCPSFLDCHSTDHRHRFRGCARLPMNSFIISFYLVPYSPTRLICSFLTLWFLLLFSEKSIKYG